jgi:hypothetical protein
LHSIGSNPASKYTAFCGRDIATFTLHCRHALSPVLVGLVYVPLKHPVHAADDVAPLLDRNVPGPHARHRFEPPSL